MICRRDSIAQLRRDFAGLSRPNTHSGLLAGALRPPGTRVRQPCPARDSTGSRHARGAGPLPEPPPYAWMDGGRGLVDPVISDRSMPGMNGVALVREVQQRRPGLPALLLTGFATDAAEIAVSGAVSGTFSLLRRPIGGRQLAGRVAVTLERALSPGHPNGHSP